MNQFLSFEASQFPRTNISLEDMKAFQTEAPFVSQAVDLFEEVRKITWVIACSMRLDENNQPREWNRNEAVLGGLMIRSFKLQDAILDQVCKNRLEIADILFRCLIETIINLRFLLSRNTNEQYDEYIKYSLRVEKRLLQHIEENIAQRGHELPIETRMKKSASGAIASSGFSLEEEEEADKRGWGGGIFQRWRAVGISDYYFPLFTMPSHAVHGNWQDLITHHVKQDNAFYSPSPEWTRSRPQGLHTATVFCADCDIEYTRNLLPECDARTEMISLLEDVVGRTRTAVEGHERFLLESRTGKSTQ